MTWSTIAILIGCLCIEACTAGKSRKPPSGVHILDGICMAKRTDRLVYRHKNDTDVYLAFDILKKGKVHLYSWKIIKAEKGTFISRMTETTLHTVDFRKMVNREHILGACSKARYKKFKGRLIRKMKHCDRKKDKKKFCKIADIISVLMRLKIRKVTFNENDEEECKL